MKVQMNGTIPMALLAAALIVLGTAVPAAAVPPANDSYAGRTVIGSTPFAITQDTSAATTDAGDETLNECGAEAMDASVWFSITATRDGFLHADASGSDYSARTFVATGSPGSFVVQDCAGDSIAWNAVAGETYSLVIVDDQFPADGRNGGLLALRVELEPEVDVRVNGKGRVTRTGSAIVGGQIACDGDTDLVSIEVALTQRFGRTRIRGAGRSDLACEGDSDYWSMEIVPSRGRFRPGAALSVTDAKACGLLACGRDFRERTIRLTSARR